MIKLRSFQLNKDNAILVIVDIQNEFCKPGGKFFDGRKTEIMPQVISTVQGLAGKARKAGIPVVYIRGVRTLREPEFTVFGVKPMLALGSWGAEIVDELKPLPGEPIVQKFTHDPFYNSDLDQVLKKMVSEPTKCHVIVTGGVVNVCLYHAVMGFHLRDYWTVVPVDGVYYYDDADNRRAQEQFSHPAYPNIFLSRSDLLKME